MDKRFLVAGSLFGMLAVIIGAFGAHGLEELLSSNQLATFETGVKYQMYHALLLLILGLIGRQSKVKTAIFWLLLIGILLFSGSIYGLATNSLTAFNFTKLGFLTPVGGLLLILAWGIILIKALTLKKQ